LIALNVIRVRNYISPSKLPGVDYVANPYVGCPHKCMYCYAEFMKRFTDHSEPWGDFVDVKRCDEPINLVSLRGKHVMLSSVTDPYNPYEKKYGVTRGILEQLKFAECSVGITTKSYLVVRDIDLFKTMPNVRVAISMNSTDDGFRSEVEPYASSVTKRVEAMNRLHDAGIATVLFMSPIFPILTDIKGVVDSVRNCADEFWFEHLKLRGPYRPRVLNYIKSRYPQYADTYRYIYEMGGRDYWEGVSDLIDSISQGMRYDKFISW
jgi:DNA repair photolyase